MSNDFLNPSKYLVSVKADPNAPLSETHIKALEALVAAQGNLDAINPTARSALAELQAKYATDPNIAGDAAAADFSIRTVSIHKTWSWFKNFSSTGPFDPLTLPRVGLNLGHLVKRRK